MLAFLAAAGALALFLCAEMLAWRVVRGIRNERWRDRAWLIALIAIYAVVMALGSIGAQYFS